MNDSTDLIDKAVDVVKAHVANNTVSASELAGMIRQVYDGLVSLTNGPVQAAAAPKEPAVPIKKSVTQTHLVCLECGKKFKIAKRHLETTHDLTPEEYRTKWGLGKDYPMVAPAYASARSDLAKSSGLGQEASGGGEGGEEQVAWEAGCGRPHIHCACWRWTQGRGWAGRSLVQAASRCSRPRVMPSDPRLLGMAAGWLGRIARSTA